MKIHKYIGKRSTNANVKEQEVYFDNSNEDGLYLDYNKIPFTGIIKEYNWLYIMLNGIIIHDTSVKKRSTQNLEELYNKHIKESVFK